ncbi:MAG TPA: DUF3047 domain-containing protein [Burkholderiaceae bacterium]|nr:DUF3047 domain-containing protein [Burkholderiaceae bacterium]
MPRLLSLLIVLLAGCAATPPDGKPWPDVEAFSTNAPGHGLPRGWQPWIVNRAKTPTVYQLVTDPSTGRVVLRAVAERSASGLKQRLDVHPAERPVVAWRWRVVDLIAAADNQDRYSEDSPVRLMLFFDGDRSQLSMKEQMLMETAHLLTGQEVPFATLMYVWENRFGPETVLRNAYTDQVKMIVVGTGRDRIGTWKLFQRNYVEDYRRAFGHAPGRLVGVGVMTDTDNTGESVEAYYGDIVLRTGGP